MNYHKYKLNERLSIGREAAEIAREKLRAHNLGEQFKEWMEANEPT